MTEYDLFELKDIFPESFVDVISDRTVIVTILRKHKLKTLQAHCNGFGWIFDFKYNSSDDTTTFKIRTLKSLVKEQDLPIS